MSLEIIHLRKLLKLLYLTPSRQVSELRADIRQDIAKEHGSVGGGGDFHGPFWSDARDHVFHRKDLHDSVRERIASNPGRERLYPRLRDGFLQWWNERRRWTNEPFQPAQAPHARLTLNGLGTIKVENLLAVRDAAGEDHFVYPYFAEAPLLNNEAARVGLWILQEALPRLTHDEIRILDVLRGQTFSLDRTPLQGDERAILVERYSALVRQWHTLYDEYL
jgi:hypothetical protein